MGKFVDMTGWVMSEHGVPDSRLIVVGLGKDYITSKGIKIKRWLCSCSCGSNKTSLATTRDLKSGHIKSCGCLRNEKAALRGHQMWKQHNTYDLSGECGIGYTLNKEQFYFDIEDYDKIKDYCWYIGKDGYVAAYNTNSDKIIKLHRLIMNFPKGADIDHINHKLNDNRKVNLRICEHMKNMMNQSKRSDNTSGVPGVNYCKATNQWMSRIGVNGKRILLGLFDSFDAAVKVRKSAEEKYYQQFSYDNSTRSNKYV